MVWPGRDTLESLQHEHQLAARLIGEMWTSKRPPHYFCTELPITAREGTMRCNAMRCGSTASEWTGIWEWKQRQVDDWNRRKQMGLARALNDPTRTREHLVFI